jgi:NADH dehydrogenase
MHGRRPVVAVLGAGFGGLAAARALAREPVDVALVDRTNHHLFQPLLYQVATASLSPADVAIAIRAVFARRRNVRVLWAEVVGFDLPRRRVLLDRDHLAYDHLVVALGSRTHWFGNDAWARHAHGLKDLADAVALRAKVLVAFEEAERAADDAEREPLLTFVIVGGGATGVELAGAVADVARRTLRDEYRTFDPASARVVLLEGGPRILPTFSESLATAARAALERQGVRVVVDAPVTAIDADGVSWTGGRLRARTVVWAAGVRALPVLERLGLPLAPDGRVAVLPDLTLPGHPEVQVIGDAAAVPWRGGLVPATAPPAIQMGRHAAQNVLRAVSGRPSLPFRFRDRGTLAVIGRGFAVADLPRRRLAGRLAWFVWAFVHVAFLVGFRNRAAVVLEWAWAYLTDRRSARLLLGETPGRRDAT